MGRRPHGIRPRPAIRLDIPADHPRLAIPVWPFPVRPFSVRPSLPASSGGPPSQTQAIRDVIPHAAGLFFARW